MKRQEITLIMKQKNNSEMNNKIDKGHLLSTFDNSQRELFSNHENLPSTKQFVDARTSKNEPLPIN